MMLQTLQNMAFLDAVGLSGAILYLVSYMAVQTGHVDGNGLFFTLANTTAAGFVLVGLSQDFNLASAIIQAAWLLIGAHRLIAAIVHNGIKRTTDLK